MRLKASVGALVGVVWLASAAVVPHRDNIPESTCSDADADEVTAVGSATLSGSLLETATSETVVVTGPPLPESMATVTVPESLQTDATSVLTLSFPNGRGETSTVLVTVTIPEFSETSVPWSTVATSTAIPANSAGDDMTVTITASADGVISRSPGARQPYVLTYTLTPDADLSTPFTGIITITPQPASPSGAMQMPPLESSEPTVTPSVIVTVLTPRPISNSISATARMPLTMTITVYPEDTVTSTPQSATTVPAEPNSLAAGSRVLSITQPEVFTVTVTATGSSLASESWDAHTGSGDVEPATTTRLESSSLSFGGVPYGSEADPITVPSQSSPSSSAPDQDTDDGIFSILTTNVPETTGCASSAPVTIIDGYPLVTATSTPTPSSPALPAPAPSKGSTESIVSVTFTVPGPSGTATSSYVVTYTVSQTGSTSLDLETSSVAPGAPSSQTSVSPSGNDSVSSTETQAPVTLTVAPGDNDVSGSSMIINTTPESGVSVSSPLAGTTSFTEGVEPVFGTPQDSGYGAPLSSSPGIVSNSSLVTATQSPSSPIWMTSSDDAASASADQPTVVTVTVVTSSSDASLSTGSGEYQFGTTGVGRPTSAASEPTVVTATEGVSSQPAIPVSTGMVSTVIISQTIPIGDGSSTILEFTTQVTIVPGFSQPNLPASSVLSSSSPTWTEYGAAPILPSLPLYNHSSSALHSSSKEPVEVGSGAGTTFTQEPSLVTLWPPPATSLPLTASVTDATSQSISMTTLDSPEFGTTGTSTTSSDSGSTTLSSCTAGEGSVTQSVDPIAMYTSNSTPPEATVRPSSPLNNSHLTLSTSYQLSTAPANLNTTSVPLLSLSTLPPFVTSTTLDTTDEPSWCTQALSAPPVDIFQSDILGLPLSATTGLLHHARAVTEDSDASPRTTLGGNILCGTGGARETSSAWYESPTSGSGDGDSASGYEYGRPTTGLESERSTSTFWFESESPTSTFWSETPSSGYGYGSSTLGDGYGSSTLGDGYGSSTFGDGYGSPTSGPGHGSSTTAGYGYASSSSEGGYGAPAQTGSAVPSTNLPSVTDSDLPISQPTSVSSATPYGAPTFLTESADPTAIWPSISSTSVLPNTTLATQPDVVSTVSSTVTVPIVTSIGPPHNQTSTVQSHSTETILTTIVPSTATATLSSNSSVGQSSTWVNSTAPSLTSQDLPVPSTPAPNNATTSTASNPHSVPFTVPVPTFANSTSVSSSSLVALPSGTPAPSFANSSSVATTNPSLVSSETAMPGFTNITSVSTSSNITASATPAPSFVNSTSLPSSSPGFVPPATPVPTFTNATSAAPGLVPSTTPTPHFSNTTAALSNSTLVPATSATSSFLNSTLAPNISSTVPSTTPSPPWANTTSAFNSSAAGPSATAKPSFLNSTLTASTSSFVPSATPSPPWSNSTSVLHSSTFMPSGTAMPSFANTTSNPNLAPPTIAVPSFANSTWAANSSTLMPSTTPVPHWVNSTLASHNSTLVPSTAPVPSFANSTSASSSPTPTPSFANTTWEVTTHDITTPTAPIPSFANSTWEATTNVITTSTTLIPSFANTTWEVSTHDVTAPAGPTRSVANITMTSISTSNPSLASPSSQLSSLLNATGMPWTSLSPTLGSGTTADETRTRSSSIPVSDIIGGGEGVFPIVVTITLTSTITTGTVRFTIPPTGAAASSGLGLPGSGMASTAAPPGTAETPGASIMNSETVPTIASSIGDIPDTTLETSASEVPQPTTSFSTSGTLRSITVFSTTSVTVNATVIVNDTATMGTPDKSTALVDETVPTGFDPTGVFLTVIPRSVRGSTPEEMSSPTAFAGAEATVMPASSSVACGAGEDRGVVLFKFEDIPPSQAGKHENHVNAQAQRLPSLYHRFTFSDGFHVVTQREARRQASSGSKMLQYNASSPAQIGVGHLRENTCFRFDFQSISLGCDSADQPCIFKVSGLQWDGSEDTVQSDITFEVAACSTASRCALGHHTLDPTVAPLFANLTAINITLAAPSDTQTWWADDVQIAWTSDDCTVAACRARAPSPAAMPGHRGSFAGRAKRLFRWALRG